MVSNYLEWCVIIYCGVDMASYRWCVIVHHTAADWRAGGESHTTGLSSGPGYQQSDPTDRARPRLPK